MPSVELLDDRDCMHMHSANAQMHWQCPMRAQSNSVKVIGISSSSSS